MTRLLFAYCILTILASCTRTNLLTYRHKKYYTEYSIITTDTAINLHQSICYNRPEVIDEEGCYELTLTFLDTTAAKTKKNLNLATDTLIVKSRYGISSIWNWTGEKNKVTGQIRIIAWNRNAVTIKENIFVSDYMRKETRKYKGLRTFKRKGD